MGLSRRLHRDSDTMTATSKFAKTKDCQILCRDEVIPVGSLVEIRNNFMIYDGEDGTHPRPVDTTVITGLVVSSKSSLAQRASAITYAVFTNDEIRNFLNTAWDIKRLQ